MSLHFSLLLTRPTELAILLTFLKRNCMLISNVMYKISHRSPGVPNTLHNLVLTTHQIQINSSLTAISGFQWTIK